MRKVIVISMVAFVFIVLGFSSIASASCGMCKAEPFEKGEVINDTCPVMGGEVDKNTPYKTEYKDKTIGFCCPGCIEKFKSDPEKYMAKLEKKCTIKCPECGAEIDLKKMCEKKEEMGGTCSL